ncbi:MAG: HD domain-containing protein [Geobacter sp.]|nr:MAG: HD domain-containing protein [Geobacter sp.]
MTWLRRAVYRVRQLAIAVVATIRPLAADERAEARAWLPESAWPLFDAMPRNDQHHSLKVMRSLRAGGHHDAALMQAALLHDLAKSTGGVTLFHRVGVVLLKALQPNWAARMAQAQAPTRGKLHYPFWVLASHPHLGAEMAAAAGCDPLAVTLIRRHQETCRGTEEQRSRGDGERSNESISESQSPVLGQPPIDHLLAALQAADDDN